jgi:hypothetical protein
MQDQLGHPNGAVGVVPVRVLTVAEPAEEPPEQGLAELQQGLALDLASDAVHEHDPDVGLRWWRGLIGSIRHRASRSSSGQTDAELYRRTPAGRHSPVGG